MTDRKTQNIEEQRKWDDSSMWSEDGNEWSTDFGGTEKLWEEIIKPRIDPYLSGNILEIAPGHGRITQYLIGYSDLLIAIDLNESCIERCKERFKGSIIGFVNDGSSLDMVKSNSIHFVFSWDSFVHIHADVIDSYLKEIYRVLKPGGVSVIHHSYLKDGNDLSFKNISGRSNMNPLLFKKMSEKYGFKIIYQELFPWNAGLNDMITTIKKI